MIKIENNKIPYKLQAAFSKKNSEKIQKIIHAEKNPIKLAKIPPYFIVMDITWNCNYRCINCIDDESVNKDKKNLSIDLIEDIFNYSKKHGVRGIMTMGGEVFMHEEGIKKAMKKSLEYQIPIKTVTNGSLLDKFTDQIVETYKIPGSVLRVSINAGQHYSKQVGVKKARISKILNNIEKITNKGGNVYASTIIFPEASKKEGFLPNVPDLYGIIKNSERAGVKTHILLPARNPITKQRYNLNDPERATLSMVETTNYKLELVTANTIKENKLYNKNLQYRPCPSGSLFTLIGSNGKIYKCTDNRGRDGAVIGEISNPGDFEKMWHSEKRVQNQINTPCKNKGCTRDTVNLYLDVASQLYSKGIIDLAPFLKVESNNAVEQPIWI